MRIKTMKFIDETFSPLVCFIFYWHNRVRKLFVRSPYTINPESVKNILLLKFFGMGSIILATPMMRALKARFPHAKLIIFTFASNKEICERIELIDEIVIMDPGNPFRIIKSLLACIRKIRRKHCEISIDLEFFAKSSSLVQYLCGTKIRVGFYIIQFGTWLKMLWRGDLLTHNVYYNPHRHTTEVFLALARSIGADTEDLSPAPIKIYDEDTTNLSKLFSEINIRENDFIILININSSSLCVERRWPIEKFVDLTKKLRDQSAARIILLGDEHDKEYVDKFFGLLGDDEKLINLAGRLNLGMLAGLFKRANLFITNDSGPLHIAASLGIPAISFFGPEIPERYGPYGKEQTVFYSGVYCSPCLNVYNQKSAMCGGENECMRKISVEEVFNVIQQKYLKSASIR
jgi:ADP-heptose:LPS heptosyltransferase